MREIEKMDREIDEKMLLEYKAKQRREKEK